MIGFPVWELGPDRGGPGVPREETGYAQPPTCTSRRVLGYSSTESLETRQPTGTFLGE